MNEIADNPAKAARRQEMIEAAFAEFSEKGYAGASMEAIARRVRASKETLYAWFENKETLLFHVFAARMGGLASRVGALSGGAEPPPDKVLPIVAEDLVGFLLATAPLVQGLGGGESSEKAMRMLGERIRQERRRFVDYLLRCRARGEIAFDDDPFELASLFVAMAEGEWTLRLGTGMIDAVTPAMIQDHARRVTRIFLKGVAPG